MIIEAFPQSIKHSKFYKFLFGTFCAPSDVSTYRLSPVQITVDLDSSNAPITAMLGLSGGLGLNSMPTVDMVSIMGASKALGRLSCDKNEVLWSTYVLSSMQL